MSIALLLNSDLTQKTTNVLKQQKQFVKTHTFDKDMAFANYQTIAKQLKAKTFFTHSSSSQEKGTVENRIWVVRMLYPKKKNFNLISHHQIKRVENCINKRPVRKINYLILNQL